MAINTVITAATSGIGAAIVQNFLVQSIDLDDRIVVNYGHNDQTAQNFYASLPAEQQCKVLLMKADLSSYDAMMAFVAQLHQRLDHIDRLICNAGISTYKPFDDYTIDDWNKIMNTNVTIPVFMIKELKSLICHHGKVILMGSYSGEVAYSSSVVYGTSKAAIHFLAKTLVKELEDKSICINAVAPGFIETPWQTDRTDESRRRINQKIALHRFGTAKEVADLVTSVVQNDYINGTVLEIHGGYGYF